MFQLVQVGALEVQNVKRAINRYGTLPKCARIGAYLESLRQSGVPSSNQEGIPASSSLSASIEQQEITNSLDTPQHRSLSPRQNNLRNQPQMTRSNSSSGVVSTYQPPSSPRSRAVSTRKNNSENIGLRTFRAPNTSTFRTASPSRAVQPTLADLEFPPPPLDLPPPPCDLFNPGGQCDSLPPVGASPGSDTSHSKIVGSPIGVRKGNSERRSKDDSNEDPDERNNDVRNTEPSVKEASSRFGVSLRRREPSGEPISSTVKQQHVEDKKGTYNNKASKESSGSKTEATSPVSHPEDAPPPPPPPPPLPSTQESIDTFISKPGMKEMLELKLINEIKQSAEMKYGDPTRKTSNPNNSASVPLDPASQLLSELCASFSIEAGRQIPQNEYASTIPKCVLDTVGGGVQERLASSRSTTEKYGNYKETRVSSPITEGILNPGSVGGFKLKKVDKRSNPQKDETGSEGQIIDFKARLRKVDNADKSEDKIKRSDEPSVNPLTESLTESVPDDQMDDKRRSTGSISSLKKLWENKEASGDNQPLSPKLSTKGGGKHDIDPGEDSPEDHSAASTRSSTSKGDPRIWPPTTASVEIEKPLVPAKPPKPLVSTSKHFGSSIYATPNCNKFSLASDEETSKQSNVVVGLLGDSKGAKNNVMEISNAIESSIVNLKGSPTIVIANWLQLSDKVGLLHGKCANLTDVVIAPQARFQFRDLLSRMESQARQLRAAGTRNVTENSRLLNEVQNTIKDVVNTVQR